MADQHDDSADAGRDAQGQQPLVLVVDDDPDVVRLVALTLSRLPVRVETRSAPFGVLNAIAELKPALVVLDVMMPGLDGAQLTGLVREDPELSRTSILLYSALDEQELESRAAACGADGWLAKTAGPKALTEQVRRRLDL